MPKLKVGGSYLNVAGDLVTIVASETSEYPASSLVFIDQDGRRYTGMGRPMSGNRYRRLIREAQRVEVGGVYLYTWNSDSVPGRYTVVRLGQSGYHVVWSSGTPQYLEYGSDLNVGAVRL